MHLELTYKYMNGPGPRAQNTYITLCEKSKDQAGSYIIVWKKKAQISVVANIITATVVQSCLA